MRVGSIFENYSPEEKSLSTLFTMLKIDSADNLSTHCVIHNSSRYIKRLKSSVDSSSGFESGCIEWILYPSLAICWQFFSKGERPESVIGVKNWIATEPTRAVATAIPIAKNRIEAI